MNRIIGLGFTMFMILALYALLDPFYTGFGVFRVTRDIGPLKYVPLILGFTIAGLALARIYSTQSPIRRLALRATLSGSVPLIIFGIWVISASLYARIFLNIEETYLQLGAGVLAYFHALVLYVAEPRGLAIARRFMFWLIIVAMPFMFTWLLISRINGGQAFHTEIFLLTPLAVYAYLHFKQRPLAWLIMLTAIAAGILSQKNTGYLVTLLVCSHLLILGFGRHRFSKGVLRFGWLVLLLIVTGIVLFLFINREEYLPTGSTHVRFVTYLNAWGKFISSPIYGVGFSETTLVQLEGGVKVMGDVDQVVTHSDLLDILSHGGVFAISLLLAILVGRLRQAKRALAMRPDPESRALIHGLVSIIISGLIVAAFNVPWLSLTIALFYWFALGLLQAVATDVLRARVPSNRKKRNQLVMHQPQS